MKSILVSLVTVLCFTSALHAATLTVGMTGQQYGDIQAAVDKAKSGDTISIAAGTYYTVGPIRIEGKRNLTITADRANVVCTEIYENVIEITYSENILIYGLTAGHQETPYCSGDVILIEYSRNVTVKQCDLYGCGVCGIDYLYCTNMEAINNNLHDNSYAGICTYACSGIKVKDNTFVDNETHFALDYTTCDYNGTFANNIVLSGNTFTYSEDYGVNDDYYEDEYYEDDYYEDADGSLYHPDEAYSGKTLTVGSGRNYQYDSLTDAIDAAANGDTIRIAAGTYYFDNTVNIVAKKDLIIEGVGDVTLYCNSEYDSVISIYGCGQVTIRNVHAQHTEEAHCWAAVISCERNDKVTLDNCELNGSGQIGVYGYLYDGNSITVKDCHIHDNSLYAMYVYDYAYDGGTCSLSVSGSTIENNADGIVIGSESGEDTLYSAADAGSVRSQSINVSIRNTTMRNNGERPASNSSRRR